MTIHKGDMIDIGELWKPTHRHIKSGGRYRVLMRGRLESDLTPVVIYENLAHDVWVRPAAEFDDGRFAKIDQ